MAELTSNNKEKDDRLICPFCFSNKGLIYVQSHYQCLNCKQVTDPCCGGEVCFDSERLTDYKDDEQN